jgi:hypothetical protein
MLELDEASIEAIAQRVAELLSPAKTGEMVSAAEIAKRFGVSRDWVYEHADELGVIRMGSGPRAHLRFDLEKVAEGLDARKAPPVRPEGRTAGSNGRKRRRSTRETGLLEIRGEIPSPRSGGL